MFVWRIIYWKVYSSYIRFYLLSFHSIHVRFFWIYVIWIKKDEKDSHPVYSEVLLLISFSWVFNPHFQPTLTLLLRLFSLSQVIQNRKMWKFINSHSHVFYERGVLKNFTKIHESTFFKVSFFKRLLFRLQHSKGVLPQVFSQDIIFAEHYRVTATENI